MPVKGSVLLWVCVLLVCTKCGSSSDGNALNVLWMAPKTPVLDDQGHPILSAHSSVGALRRAIEKVNSEQLVGSKTINVTWVDSACDPQVSLGRLVFFLHQRAMPDLIVGPPCTTAVVQGLLCWMARLQLDISGSHSLGSNKLWLVMSSCGAGINSMGSLPMKPWYRWQTLGPSTNIPVFSWLANEHTVDNKTRAATLVRTFPPLSGLGKLLLHVCRELGWRRLAIVSTRGILTEGIASFLHEIVVSDEYFTLARHYSNVNVTLSQQRLRGIMANLRREVRVICLIIPNYKLREYLLAAHDEGMTSGDFQFLFTAQTLRPESDLQTLRSDAMWKRNDTRDDDARQAYRNLLYLTFTFILEYNFNSLEFNGSSTSIFNMSEAPIVADMRDVHARFLYDAFYLYALAYNDTVGNRHLPATGRNIFATVPNIIFDGMTGKVTMDSEADRLPSYLVWDMGLDNTFRIVLRLSYTQNSTGHPLVEIERHPPGIYWGNGKSEDEDNYVPPDTPPCGFDNEFCPPDNSLKAIVSSVSSAVMLAAVIVFFIMYRWWKKEQELNRRNWQVRWTQLSFKEPSAVVSSTNQSKLSGSQTSLSDTISDHTQSQGGGSAFSSLLSKGWGIPNPTMYCKTARLGTSRVAVRVIRKKNIRVDRKLLEGMRLLTTIKHVNLASFHGVCMDPPNLCVLWEYCYKGSIQDVFRTCKMTEYKMDSMFQISIAMDVCAGLAYLHNSELKVHGNLKSGNCLVDNRWTCKLAGFGQSHLLKGERPDPTSTADQNAAFSKLFWTAPEALRLILKGERYTPTQEADIYSVAIVLKEVLCKNEAFEEEMHVKGLTPKEIIGKVSATPQDTLFRPCLTDLPDEPASLVYSFVHLIHACWQEDASLRPPARRLLRHMRKLNPFKTNNILDNMVQMMEKYSTRLEELVAQRTCQLEDEKRKTDALLYRMLPQKVAEDLKRGEHVQAEAFTSVTIYFSDIVGFTQIASYSTPMEIVDFLNSLYTVYDDIIREYDVYKVETIGDAYMVVSGIPVPNGTRHVTIMADMALALLQAVFDFVIPHMPETQLRIRIGLNTGPVVAGVVGTMMPRYCLFGDTVNLASRMESHGVPLKIHLSPYTYDVIKDHEQYTVAERGEIDVKGKGRMRTYFLEGKMTSQETDTCSDQNEARDKVQTPSAIELHRATENVTLAGKDNC